MICKNHGDVQSMHIFCSILKNSPIFHVYVMFVINSLHFCPLWMNDVIARIMSKNKHTEGAFFNFGTHQIYEIFSHLFKMIEHWSFLISITNTPNTWLDLQAHNRRHIFFTTYKYTSLFKECQRFSEFRDLVRHFCSFQTIEIN